MRRLTLFVIGNKLPIAIFLIVSGVLPSASEGLIGIVVSTVFIYIAGVMVVNQRYTFDRKPLPVTDIFSSSSFELAFISFAQVDDSVLCNEKCCTFPPIKI